jgi:hypothetical protein
MKKGFHFGLFLILFSFAANAQTGNRVLIEEFTETGCGACSQYDSAFQALTNANAEKVAVLNYHCFYALDTFYTYNKACDTRYAQYDLTGFPSAAVNGKKPSPSSGHLSYVNQSLIDKLYDTPPQFKFDIKCKASNKGNSHSTKITVTATALKDYEGKDLRLLVVATENNINHEQRYHAKAVNGVNEFNHIVRAFLPDKEGTPIGDQKSGKVNTVKVAFTNDDKEINFKEVRIVAFIQDSKTHEIIGSAVTTEHPFK